MVKYKKGRQTQGKAVVSIGQELPAFLEYLQVYRDYRPITISVIKSRLKIIDGWCQNNRVEFNQKSFELYILYLKGIQTHSRYIEAFIEAVRRLCDYLVKTEKIEHNWAKDIPMPKRIKTLPNVLSAEEIDAILKTSPKHRYK